MGIFNYKRRKSSVVSIGSTPLGGDYPVRIQSMTNTSTLDTEGSVQQCIRIIEAGGEYVRLTAQGVREAENLQHIEDGLHALGYHTPLIADIHFNPRAAEAAARIVEKVRINPGNFVDPVKTFRTFEYTPEEYVLEVEKIRERFVPFLNICKEHRTAIRIGVNHGSLSDRIMSRYGDTPQGMVESCMEFLRICIDENFRDVVISIKASNTVVMVSTVRLLVQTMEAENMYFPLHLGVTEAGDGEDGRIKSAVGIGALLADGIGDTIRVSLSEDPEAEIPVARKLVQYIRKREDHVPIIAEQYSGYNPVTPSRRITRAVTGIGGMNVPVVVSDRSNGDFVLDPSFLPDFIYTGRKNTAGLPKDIPLIVDQTCWNDLPGTYPCFFAFETEDLRECEAPLKFVRLTYEDLTPLMLDMLSKDSSLVVILHAHHFNSVGSHRAAMHRLLTAGCDVPVILFQDYDENEIESLQIKSAADFGTLLLDGFGDGLMLQGGNGNTMITDSCMFGILQAARARISKTEYISCPGCGRTLFDLQTTIRKVKAATHHLKGLKIGIMGCIVNGPGEMADADYGYVGAGLGRVSLYKGKECMEKNIPEEKAVDQLIKLIKRCGDWKEENTEEPKKDQ